jgi:glycopeptide antibiotics resistance protein
MIDFFPYPFWFGIFGLSSFVLINRKRFEKFTLFFMFVFGFYLLLVIGATLFPVPYAYRQSGFEGLKLSRINLIPFNFGRLFNVSSFLILWQLLGNILLTIPFGFGINFILSLKPKLIFPLSLLSGLIIEMTQLFCTILLGISYRSVDINDVILNFAGSLLGFGMFYLFAWIYTALFKRLKKEPRGFLLYLLGVTRRALKKEKPPCVRAVELNG